jgi:hypothetical protein
MSTTNTPPSPLPTDRPAQQESLIRTTYKAMHPLEWCGCAIAAAFCAYWEGVTDAQAAGHHLGVLSVSVVFVFICSFALVSLFWFVLRAPFVYLFTEGRGLLLFILGCLFLWGAVHVLRDVHDAFAAVGLTPDSAGYLAHTVDTVVTAHDGWMNGESKACYSLPLDPSTARAENKDAGDAFARIECDENGPDRHVKVMFYGREDQPEYRAVDWQCTRTTGLLASTAFTCKETGGIR